MARRKTTPPSPQRQPGQISLDVEDYLVRYVDNWHRPQWWDATRWRQAVDYQPVALDCRETIVAQILALEYKIEPRESTERDELKEDIRYYNKLLEDSGELDYSGLVEWVLSDYLDIPFGGAVEVGREGDSEEGQVRWLLPIDGATLFPTANYDWPVGQGVPNQTIQKVYFPRHAVNRIYMSPRREIHRSGWGCAPPEKIYMALEMINRGDRYYANLLLDTPEAGILDLQDMSKDSAKTWIKGWQEMLSGVDPFKIPVLYEHEKEAKFIPFVRSPTELMFDKALLKYSALVTSGYGLSLSDINVPQVSSGGDTLAGSIRGERKTRRTGIARAKRALTSFWNRILPPALRFSFIDLDDEVSVALSRARLANATAAQIFVSSRIFTPQETRLQTIADGLFSIPLAETPNEADFPPLPAPGLNGSNRQTGLMGRPIAPSQGGYGEAKSLDEQLFQRAYTQLDGFKNAYEETKERWLTASEDEKEQRIRQLEDILAAYETMEE